MSEKTIYEVFEQRVRELDKAEPDHKDAVRALPEGSSETAQPFIKVLMICFLLLICLFTGQVHAQDLSEEELHRRNMVIAIDEGYAPQTFLDVDDQPVGIFVDIWRLWSNKIGINVTFLRGNWNDSLANLKSGKADIHSGLFYSDTRAEWIAFSQPFYGVGSYLFSLAESDKIDNPKERERLYWQDDHVRLYGTDYAKILSSVGFDVTEDDYVKTIDSKLAQRYALPTNEIIYLCKKPLI